MKPNSILLPLLLLASVSSAVDENDIFTEEQTAKIVEFVETVMECRGVTGLTLAVVKGNDTWTRGFGLADRETGRKVTTSTLFGIGSVSKQFTSALMSLFINETGKYFWNTRLVDILGKDFKFVDEQLTQQVTLKDMLVHRTGLEVTELPLVAGVHMTRAELSKLIRYLPVKLEFRDQFDYNNWMYGLAGHVVEVMGGAPWEELLQTHILDPLGMDVTTVLSKKVTVEDNRFAKPYVTLAGELVLSDPDIYYIAPYEAAGAIASSADDMAKWMVMHINKGKSQSGQVVLNSKRMSEMHAPYVSLSANIRSSSLWQPEFPVTISEDGYGYAWFTGSYRGYASVYHSGSIFAYATYLAFLPAIDLGVFVSTNGPGDSNAFNTMRHLYYFVADLALGEDPWLNPVTACQYPSPWFNQTGEEKNPNDTSVYDTGEEKNPNDTSDYDDPDFDNVEHFVGTYKHRLYGDVHVLRNGSNNLEAKYGRFEGRLYRTDKGNLAMWKIRGSMTFIFQPGNETSYMALYFFWPSDDGVFGVLAMSMSGSSSEFIVFTRDGYDVGGTGGGRRHGVSFHIVCLLACLYLYTGFATSS